MCHSLSLLFGAAAGFLRFCACSSLTPSECDCHRHILIVFGGVAGLEASVDADEQLNLRGEDTSALFDMWVNTCPVQGSRTIRTEVGCPPHVIVCDLGLAHLTTVLLLRWVCRKLSSSPWQGCADTSRPTRCPRRRPCCLLHAHLFPLHAHTHRHNTSAGVRSCERK